MLLAIVNNDIVVSIVTIVDSSLYLKYAQDVQAAIDISDLNPQPQIGWVFNGSTLSPPISHVASMMITKLAFRQRFTFAELIAIETATQNNVALRVLKDNLNVATYIDLARPDTIQAVMMLVSVGLITSDRANVILTTPPLSSESYISR